MDGCFDRNLSLTDYIDPTYLPILGKQINFFHVTVAQLSHDSRTGKCALVSFHTITAVNLLDMSSARGEWED